MYRSLPSSFDLPRQQHREDQTSGRGNNPGGLNITQNIYTKETNYAAQQREAAKNIRQIAREVYT